MPVHDATELNVTPELLEAIADFPLSREVHHCGTAFTASPLDLYARCPSCGTRLKLRSFSGVPELEDVFDAVLTWMLQSDAAAIAQKRLAEIAADAD
jgi:hypothetical protein